MPACSPPGLSNDQLLAHLVSSEHIPTHHLGIDVGYYFFSVRAEGLIRTFSSVQESRMLGWDKALHTFTASFRPLPSRPYPSSHTERCSPKMLPFPPPSVTWYKCFLLLHFSSFSLSPGLVFCLKRSSNPPMEPHQALPWALTAWTYLFTAFIYQTGVCC